MIRWQSFISHFLTLLLVATIVSGEQSKRVLLVSIDGFRYDLLNATMVPAINAWAQKNAWFVNGVASQQLTYTAPNHMSIVTGLWEESHGITGNYFIDTSTLQFYDAFNASGFPGVVKLSQQSQWYSGEPIWATNWRAGGQSAVFYWPVGDASFGEGKERVVFKLFEHNYGNLSSWKPEVDELVARMLKEEEEGKGNFYAWYLAEPDHVLHGHGFYTGEFRAKMAEIDDIFAYLLKQLEEKDLLSSTDMIVTADHGHSEISADKVFCYEHYITGTPGVDFGAGNHQLYPKTKEQALGMYQNLTKAVRERNLPIKIHWKQEIEGDWHLNHSTRVGSILFEPAIGADATIRCSIYNWTNFHHSTHGHHKREKEMRALLVMGGPSFEAGAKIDDVPENIDLYPLMARLLAVEAAPHNGTIERVAMALRLPPQQEGSSPLWTAQFFLFVLPCALLLVLIVFCVCRYKRREAKGHHSPLPTNHV